MKYYSLATGMHEEYWELPLSHPETYTEDEFIALAKEASSKIDYDYGIEQIADILIADFGFSEVEREARAYFDDWLRKWE